jgi:hypothetical protein
MHAVERFRDDQALGVPRGLARDRFEVEPLVPVGPRARGDRRCRRERRGRRRDDAQLVPNLVRVSQNDDAFDGVLQLADVPRPRMVDEALQRRGRNIDGAPILRVRRPQEVIDEGGNLVAPLTQRRDPDLDHVQPVIEVLTEAPGADLDLEIAVRGRQDADIRVEDPLAAHARELAVLQYVEKLRLKADRDLADLVEHERALRGQFELARLVAIRARERAPLMAEQLRLEQFLRQRRAIDLQELVPGARRPAMNGARDDLFPDPALAGQQHCRVGRRDLRDEITDGAHLWTVAEFQLIHQSRPLSTLMFGCRRRVVQGSRHM